jgi:hypothetical protein
MTTTPGDESTTLLVLVLLGAGPRSQFQVQRICFVLLHVRDDIELVTSGGGAEVRVTTVETS